MTQFILTDGNDTFPGPGQTNFGDDLVEGRDGNDLLYGGIGNDTLYGGAGDDVLMAGPNTKGRFVADGGAGDDRVFSSAVGNFSLEGGAGQDTLALSVATPNPLLFLVSGRDVQVSLQGGFATFVHGFETYRIDATLGADTIRTGAGDDIVNAATGENLVRGGRGNDQLSGAGVLYGGAGDDVLRADDLGATQRMAGGAGADVLILGGTTGVNDGAALFLSLIHI